MGYRLCGLKVHDSRKFYLQVLYQAPRVLNNNNIFRFAFNENALCEYKFEVLMPL